MSVLVDLCIEDFGYLVFEFTVDFDRRGWQFGTVRDRTRCVVQAWRRERQDEQIVGHRVALA